MFDPVSFAAGKAASGGGEGEPSAYIRSASVSADGLTLTLTKKDGSKVTFSVSDINSAIAALETAVDGKQNTITDLDDIREGAEKGETAVQSDHVSHEAWVFTLDDDTTVTKEVMLWTGAE